MAPTAPNLWRRPCYANSRLLQLPRHRWARRRWRRLPLPPGAATVGMVAGTAAAGAGAVHASSSVVRPIMVLVPAAAMCGDWSQRRGDLAGASSITAIEFDLNPTVSSVKAPTPRGRGFRMSSSNGTKGFSFQCQLEKPANCRQEETIFVLLTWLDVSSLERNAKRNRHEPNHQRQRTNRP